MRDARVSAVVRARGGVHEDCWRDISDCCLNRPSQQPTFAFHKAGEPVGEIRGADAAGVRAAVAELKHS